MDAKDKERQVIARYLKPTLKAAGFRTRALTWWRFSEDICLILNLQNSQWNSKDHVSFWLNFGPALSSAVRAGHVSHYQNVASVREDSFLPEVRRRSRIHRSGLGYCIDMETDVDLFIEEFSVDVEEYILPAIGRLTSTAAWLEWLRKAKADFWVEQIERKLASLQR